MKNIMMIPPAEIDGNKTAVGSKAVRTITSRFVAPLAIPVNGAYMEHPFNCDLISALLTRTIIVSITKTIPRATIMNSFL